MGAARDGDVAIVARFRATAGVERDAAFGEIFEVHRSQVFALCLRLCGERALAEDALQETFLEIYRSLSRFRGDAQLGTWIHRIALRTALHVRARQPATPTASIPSAGPHEAAGSDPNPVLAAREHVRRVQAAFDLLPAEQRAAIALFSVDGLTQLEIAAILGIPEGTVWSRLHKARRALAAALA